MSDQQRATFRIGEVARRTGMTTATLRAWERRYGVLAPVRTAGGQRLYSLADVARVARVRRLVRAGWSVAAAAGQVVGKAAPADEADSDADATVEPGPPAVPSGDVDVGTVARRQLLDSLATTDPFVVLAAYETARTLVRAVDVSDVSAAVQGFVQRLGGELGPAQLQDDVVLPVDLAFGAGPPVLPRAQPGSLARMRLETVLPLLVEDARTVAHRLMLGRERQSSGAATR